VGGAKAILHRKPTTRWIDVFAQALASGFTCFVVGTFLIHWWGEDHLDIILALVGLSGWIGPALMDYFGSIAQLVLKQRLSQAGLRQVGHSSFSDLFPFVPANNPNRDEKKEDRPSGGHHYGALRVIRIGESAGRVSHVQPEAAQKNGGQRRDGTGDSRRHPTPVCARLVACAR
jgi:hypothetical protein